MPEWMKRTLIGVVSFVVGNASGWVLHDMANEEEKAKLKAGATGTTKTQPNP